MKYKIGVMGSGVEVEDVAPKAKELGREIAKADCILITGGCPGLPYEAAKGAKEAGGLTIGVSPAMNRRDHLENFKFPTEYYDVLIFTGFERKGRNVINIRSSDAIITVGGRLGTLNEFTIAYDERVPVGVLYGTGGISDNIDKILAIANKPGGTILTEKEPKTLVEKIISILGGKNGN